jgi:hypothetical protein
MCEMALCLPAAQASVSATLATRDWIWLLVLIQRVEISKREGQMEEAGALQLQPQSL